MNNDTPADAMKLLPCPFCGGEQITTAPDHEFGDVTWDAICKACGASVRRDLEAEAIAAWNTRTTSPAAQDWRKHTALLQVKVFVDEMIEGQYNCSPHQYFMAAQGRAIDLKPVIDAAVATDPAPSLAAQVGLVDALRAIVACAYPVAAEINPRGYNWSEAYLDAALPIARAALASIEVKS